jgi:predicted HicB family RNase H-like nuclease
MKPRRGQPPKPADERADVYLHIRVRREDKARWVNQAQSEGKKLADWVRERLG